MAPTSEEDGGSPQMFGGQSDSATSLEPADEGEEGQEEDGTTASAGRPRGESEPPEMPPAASPTSADGIGLEPVVGETAGETAAAVDLDESGTPLIEYLPRVPPRRAPSQAYMQILDSESEDAEEAPVAEVPEAEAVATSADSDTAATAAGEDGAG